MDTDNIYYEKLAEIIFPDVTMTPQDMEEKFSRMQAVVNRYRRT